jgi:hypothetical protein
MKRVFINPYLALLIILIVAGGATELVLHTLNSIEKNLPAQQLYNLP